MRHFFSNIAAKTAIWMGQPSAFVGATLACIVWAVSGPYFNYSDTWQLVINTGTTVLTFLAVFLIQNSQNRDGAAIQAKLDELLRAVAGSARAFGDEMGGMAAAYNQHCSRWTADAIAADWSGYCRESGTLIDALANRIRRENLELYPLLDQLDQAA